MIWGILVCDDGYFHISVCVWSATDESHNKSAELTCQSILMGDAICMSNKQMYSDQ